MKLERIERDYWLCTGRLYGVLIIAEGFTKLGALLSFVDAARERKEKAA